MFNRFARHVPPSDPPIPTSNRCLHCGKKASVVKNESLKQCTEVTEESTTQPGNHDSRTQITLRQCSACKMAKFCSRECQAAAWNGKPFSPTNDDNNNDSSGNNKSTTVTPIVKHKKVCKELAKRNRPNMLPYQVQVIRHKNGAYIQNGQDIPTAEPAKSKEDKANMLERFDVGQDWDGNKISALSPCAQAHYNNIVRNLTKEQLGEEYPLACIERWGRQCGTVPLGELLNEKYEDCPECGSDGSQFFSFCLGRPVNDNMVHHCEFCNKCFYHQPGFLRGCQHCGMGYFYIDDVSEGCARQLACQAGIKIEKARKMIMEAREDHILIKYAECARGTNIPEEVDSFSRGLSMEGFWGY